MKVHDVSKEENVEFKPYKKTIEVSIESLQDKIIIEKLSLDIKVGQIDLTSESGGSLSDALDYSIEEESRADLLINEIFYNLNK